jgi:hypothetical protein
MDVVDAHPGGIAQRHEDDLLVRSLLVGHVEDADDAAADAAAGERRLTGVRVRTGFRTDLTGSHRI